MSDEIAPHFRVVRMGIDKSGQATEVGEAETYDNAAAVLNRKWRLDGNEWVSMSLQNKTTGKAEHRYLTHSEFEAYAKSNGLV